MDKLSSMGSRTLKEKLGGKLSTDGMMMKRVKDKIDLTLRCCTSVQLILHLFREGETLSEMAILPIVFYFVVLEVLLYLLQPIKKAFIVLSF